MDLITRLKNAIGGGSQPKNVHSLENLKHLYNILQRNRIVSNANRQLLTETLRSISEIIIWGDQNDNSLFDCCLERGILVHFIDYMNQRNGQYICIQILQTLNILFENIRSPTWTYYLLSKNHINTIITHKFDFNDEEITAYYISFLKTLSFKLNKTSIHLFFAESDRYFPLYVEAIKFFNHRESMVRIAVRTLTLNVYRVPDPPMHRFILDCTATEYFSNLVWLIRNHIIEFDHSIRNNRDLNQRARLNDSIEEYLDQIHYLEDIFLLNVDSLNNVLKEQLMNRLLIPLGVFSLIKRDKFVRLKSPRVILDEVVAMFLLAEIFFVLHYRPVVEELADIILSADIDTVEVIQYRFGEQISYSLPPVSLDVSLAKADSNNGSELNISLNVVDINNEDDVRRYEEKENARALSTSSNVDVEIKPISLYVSNWTDDEKSKRTKNPIRFVNDQLIERPYFQALIQALDCRTNDQLCFYALNVLYTMTINSSVDTVILESVCLTVKASDKSFYNTMIVDRLCDIFQSASQSESVIRIVTLDLAIHFLVKLVFNDETNVSFLSLEHFSRLEQTFERTKENLRPYFHTQELFLDMFEDEYRQTHQHRLNIEHSLKETSFFYPPTTTPLSRVEFINRLPSGDIERARRLIRVFFMMRKVIFLLKSLVDNDLPLTKSMTMFKLNDNLDWNNCDLIPCTVHLPDKKDRQFLVIDQMQFILIESDVKRIGWGIVKFSDWIQDVEVSQDKDDNRSLQISIHKPVENLHTKVNRPVLNGKFTFDDHIRCMTAKQNLLRARQTAREIKSNEIEKILQATTKIFDDY